MITKNSIVAKALNAVARNDTLFIGDRVEVKEGPHIGKQGILTVARGQPGNVAIRTSDGKIIRVSQKLIKRVPNAARVRNAVVAKALNAVAQNGYVKLYAKAGGTATVYEGDKVEYDGKVYTAKALGSPSMDSATLVDDAGNKLVVKMKDYKLKALNEDTSVVTEKAVNYTKWDGKTDMRGSSYNKTAPLWTTHHSRAKVLHSYSVPSKYIESGELLEVYGWENNGDIYVYVPSRGPVKVSKGDYEIYNSSARNASGDATTRKFKPNDLVEWNDYKGRHNSAYYFRDNGPDRVTVSIYRDGQGGFLEVPRAWITNSRACNAAGYVDASSVVLHPGDAVVFKAEYSSHKDDDEWLERNGDTVREVRGNEVKLGPSANDWAKKRDLMVWHNAARACNSNIETLVSDLDKGKYDQLNWMPKVIGKGSLYPDGMKFPSGFGYDDEEKVRQAWMSGKYASVIVYKGGSKRGELAINSCACNSTNAIVRKALNATALNFFPGDKVSIVDTDIRYGGDKGEVVRKDGFRYVVRLTSRQDKPEVLLQPNQLKAANAEDAQGYEHGKASQKSKNAVVTKALNAAGDGKDYYVVDEFGNAADGSNTPLPFDRASALFLKLTGSKRGNGKWGIIRKGEPASKARDWYGNIVSWNAVAKNADEYVIRKAFTPGKWFLERKAKSLGDAGSVKVFSSEDEARSYAKSKGLSVVNAVAKNAIGKRAIEALNAFDENAYKKTVISKIDKAIDDIEHRRKNVVHIGASKIRFPYAEEKKIKEKANKHYAQVYFDDDGEISVYRLKAWMHSAYD